MLTGASGAAVVLSWAKAAVAPRARPPANMSRTDRDKTFSAIIFLIPFYSVGHSTRSVALTGKWL
jgi:hypothetical protein